ncbi:MAG: PKD domain-containing protein [Rhizomicrobium sp.]|nr:PKD domain-containing protein [Rhizomicrobium sp.]
MDSVYDQYPVFEANQVLTSGHLNDAFDYLDQQDRLTRSHLVGIGIACGLEIALTGSTITLSKGCGVTSEGYLIIEPADVALVAYRSYTMPSALDYAPFKNGANQIALWELFPDGTPNTTPLNSPVNFLTGKAVLLFLELKKEGLRNCSPNNCDDKGSQVTATVRRLLIAKSDLDVIIAAANHLDSGLTAGDIDAALSTRLSLPDLYLRRFDVLASDPVTSNDVYTAFLDMVRTGGLAAATAAALSSAYKAYQPLLAAAYPANPFANFATAYGFLDTAPQSTDQVKFLPYYADLFDDLRRAYDEFRWQGLDLICACCPNCELFPRHLMLGLLDPTTVSRPSDYRQTFLPSPATGDCANKTKEVVQLFTRLVEMATRFTFAPALPKANPSASIDPQIRITPSTLGDCYAFESKAIPYYYAQTGTPPLYQLWSPTKTRRNRANQNLSYNADLYTNPAAPAFVTDPLRYDLEPYDFLRIEGHFGKDYQEVLRSLLTVKAQYRLPVDFIALRTGTYDDTQTVDLSQDAARFADLDAVYGALRGELMSSLAEGMMQLYDTTIPAIAGLTLNAGTPKLPLLQQYAPHYGYSANTVGSWYETYLTRFETQGYLDVDQNAINLSAVMVVYCTLFNGTQRPDDTVYPQVVAIYYLSRLFEALSQTLETLDYADFENKYQDMMALIRYFRSDAVSKVTPDLKNFLPEEEFIDLCEGILFGCRLGAIKSVSDNYTARIADLRKRLFLSNFLQEHPGVQHKAGVPIGGTFILVYHGEPAASASSSKVSYNLGLMQEKVGEVSAATVEMTAARSGTVEMMARQAPSAALSSSASSSALITAIDKISSNRTLMGDENISQIIGLLTGQIPISNIDYPIDVYHMDPAAKIIATTVGDLANGTVIADLYLPYRICCDMPGIQYVLPKVPPTFTMTPSCTGTDGKATITIAAKGGIPPYDVAVDAGAYRALSGPLQLTAGDHSIMLRDADGTETPAQTITVAASLVIGVPTYTCADGKYTGTASITGGTPPYQVDGKAAPNAVVVTDPTASGTAVSVTVTDSMGCTATTQFNHTCPPPCTLPCAGAALNRGYRFFLPDADPKNPYQSFTLTSATLTVDSSVEPPPTKTIDLSAEFGKILVATAAQLTPAQFPVLVDNWIKAINKLIAGTDGLYQAGKAQWLTLDYKIAAPGQLGLLTIDYFQCLSFQMQIEANYVREADKGALKVSYTPKGTTIQMGGAVVTIPAFDGTSTDKCADKPVTASLCPVPPDFTVKIQQKANTAQKAQAVVQSYNFTVTASVPVSGLIFVWEAQDGAPAMGNGQTFATQFKTAGPKLITVTAFNTKGCSATASLTVQVG